MSVLRSIHVSDRGPRSTNAHYNLGLNELTNTQYTGYPENVSFTQET